MMPSQQWGRKETVIFPPHSAIYTYGAVFLAVVMNGCFLYVRFAYGQTPLQQFYTPHNAVVQGLEVSRGDVLQHQLLQAQLRHQSLQLRVLLLQLLQPACLVHLQPAILLAPSVVRLLHNLHFLARLW